MPLVGLVEGRYRVGPVDAACDQLRRVVGAYAREGRWAKLKVGYTSNPKNRWQGYQSAGYRALVPVYRTTSWRNAVVMEEMLIAYLGEMSRACGTLLNVTAGRNGRRALDASEYFTYLALAPKYARIRE